MRIGSAHHVGYDCWHKVVTYRKSGTKRAEFHGDSMLLNGSNSLGYMRAGLAFYEWLNGEFNNECRHLTPSVDAGLRPTMSRWRTTNKLLLHATYMAPQKN
jgi:hypothetical protein